MPEPWRETEIALFVISGTPVTVFLVKTYGALYSLDLRQCLVSFLKTFQGNNISCSDQKVSLSCLVSSINVASKFSLFFNDFEDSCVQFRSKRLLFHF